MNSELIGTLSIAVGAVLIVAMLCGSGLVAWRGWLKLKRMEMQSGRKPNAGPTADVDGQEETDTGTLIELAAVKERLRRLEAIASGVEL